MTLTVEDQGTDLMSGRRANYKGVLTIGDNEVPIALYKVYEEYALETKLYHEDCNERITQPYTCPEHPHLKTNVDEGEEDLLLKTYNGIDFGDVIVRVDNEVRDTMLERKAPMIFESSFKMTMLSTLINEGRIVLLDSYQALPPRTQGSARGMMVSPLFTLLDRMRIKKRFILCSVGLNGGIKRYIIILPSGITYKIAYQEELRAFPAVIGHKDDMLSTFLDRGPLSVQVDFPTVTLKAMHDRLTAWFVKQVTTVRKGK